MKLIPLIDTLLESREESRNDTRDYFHISEVDKCPRAIFYKMKGYLGEKFKADMYRKLDNGDYVHKRIMSILVSLGIVVASEIRIPESNLFHGRADAIVTIDNELYVLEIKSMNRYAFDKLEAPDPAHLKQIQLYMHYFNINKGIILVENKDSQEMKEFIVTRDDRILNEIFISFGILKEMTQANTIPPKPNFNRDEKWRCDYCPYRKVCAQHD